MSDFTQKLEDATDAGLATTMPFVALSNKLIALGFVPKLYLDSKHLGGIVGLIIDANSSPDSAVLWRHPHGLECMQCGQDDGTSKLFWPTAGNGLEEQLADLLGKPISPQPWAQMKDGETVVGLRGQPLEPVPEGQYVTDANFVIQEGPYAGRQLSQDEGTIRIISAT